MRAPLSNLLNPEQAASVERFIAFAKEHDLRHYLTRNANVLPPATQEFYKQVIAAGPDVRMHIEDRLSRLAINKPHKLQTWVEKNCGMVPNLSADA